MGEGFPDSVLKSRFSLYAFIIRDTDGTSERARNGRWKTYIAKGPSPVVPVVWHLHFYAFEESTLSSLGLILSRKG